MKRAIVLCFFILCCSGNFLYAQYTINGKITDKKMNPVNGVSVHILNSNKGEISNAGGDFIITDLTPGIYMVRFSVVGFASKNQQISINHESINLKIVLEEITKRLDEIVVTAQKKEELLQKVPISITSLSEKNVNDYRIWNSREITGIIPNLYSADPGDKRNVTSIRGITTTSYDPAAATYIDGVNQFSLDTYISPLFDVERIEVLRGPQGTLYGRNAMSGVINIITKKPANKTTGFAEVSLGNYGEQRYSAGIKAPVIKDKLFIGLAGLYDGFNGFFTNEFNNSKYDKQHSISGNGYLKFLPNNRWVATLNIKQNNNRNNGPFPLVFGSDAAFSNPYKLSQNALTRIIDNTFNTSLSLNYSGTAFNFNSQTSYQTNYRYYKTPIDADFFPFDGVTLNNNYGKNWNNVKVFTQEFKFTSPANNSSKLNWTAGTYFFHQSSPTKTATRFGEDAPLLQIDSSLINASLINTTKAKGSGIAVYGQATYAITNKLDVTAGLRYDYENKQQSVHGEYQQDPDPNPQFDFRSDTSAATHYNAFQPKVSIGYHAKENSFLFITYSKGYRAGGLTPLSSIPTEPALYPFKPEYSNNIEAGLKNSFLQNKLLLNLSVFYTTVTNAQVPTLVLPDAVTITKNTGRLISKGFEAEANTTPVKGFEITYSFGYTDAKYTKLKVAQNGSETNLKGVHQIFTPDITSMFAAQYSLKVSGKNDVNLIFRGEWKYLGTQYFDLSNTLKQSPYSLLNTRIGIETKNVEVMFYGRNLSGRKYIAYAYDFGAVHLGDPK
ncbi:MAG: TonB-dependent receptor, partial [Ginsengibacter sp.]